MGIEIPTTVNASGQPPLTGNIVIAQGTNVTVTQSGNTITIASTGSGPNMATILSFAASHG